MGLGLSIIVASKQRGDIFHIVLESKLQQYPDCFTWCHRSSVSSYTCTWHIYRALRKHSSVENDETYDANTKQCHRTDTEEFDFRKPCLICGLIYEPKKPER